MKRCSYCGAEYPDDSVMCTLDQTPLESSNPAPVPVRAEPEIPEEIPPLPKPVTIAIGCLAVSIVVSLLQTFVGRYFRQSFAYEIGGFFIILFLVFWLHGRKNWARWVIAGFTFLWLTTLVFRFRPLEEQTIPGVILFAVQLILWTVAPFMLFTRGANEWFRRSR